MSDVYVNSLDKIRLLFIVTSLIVVLSSHSEEPQSHSPNVDFDAKLNDIQLVYRQEQARGIKEWVDSYNSFFSSLTARNKVSFLVLGGEMVSFNGEIARAEELLQQAEQLLKEFTDLNLEVKVNLLKGNILSLKGEKEHAIILFEEVIKLKGKTILPDIRFQLLTACALTYYQISEYKRSLELYLLASELIPKINELQQSNRIIKLFNLLGLLNLDMGKNEEALDYLNKALTLAVKYDDKESQAHIFINKGIYHRNKNNVDGWYDNIQKSYNLGVEIKSPRIELTALTNLTDYLLTINKPVEAQQKATLAIKKAREIGNKREEAMSIGNLGISLAEQGKLDEGIAQLEQSIEILREINFRQMELMVLDAVVDLYTQKDDFKTAYKLLRDKTKLEKEVFNAEREKALANLQNKLTLQEKDRINQLLVIDLQLKNEQLNNQDLERSLMFSVTTIIILILLLILLVVFRFKERNKALVAKNSQLKLASERDPLTGLSNRRGFEKYVSNCWDEVEQKSDQNLSDMIIIMDIDHFKSINDTYGHTAGDNVLKQISSILSESIRKDEFVVRWGGEEFLMYLKNVDTRHIKTVIKRILNKVSEGSFSFEEHAIDVTLSLGFIVNPFCDSFGKRLDWHSAIKLSDEALYLSKHSGRNRAYGILKANRVDLKKLINLSLPELIKKDKVDIIEILPL